MRDKLKSCPFCGGEASFRRTRKESMTGRWDAWIVCKQCCAKPFKFEGRMWEKEEDALKVLCREWNRRANIVKS